MPINAAHRKRYPPNWPAIRAALLDRAGHRCEPCGVPNPVWRNNRTDAWTEDAGRAEAWILDGDPIARIGLTIAHLDHTPETCDPANLRALCQRGHLAYDAEHHAKTAYRTAEPGKPSETCSIMSDALLWDLNEAARQLGGVSVKTVRRLAASGAFPLVKIGRRALIPALAVTNWVNHNQQARPAQEVQACHSTNAAVSGGSASPRQTAASYGKLLKLPTADRRRSTTTTEKPNSGGR